MKTNRTTRSKKAQASTAATKARGQSTRSRPSSRPKAAPRARAIEARDAAPATVPPALNKKETIEALLRRPEGTVMTELMAATGWQEHSIRAALTGLRKAGCTIALDRNEHPTRYRIVGAL